MFLDVALDSNYKPFPGSNCPEGTLMEWLNAHPEVNVPGNMVCVGRTLEFMSVQEYIDSRSQK